jgi:phage tail sheath protein FI
MAPTYLSPGVYVEEVDGGSKPIAGVSTAVAAFVGFAKQGPVNQATLVTNWTQYVDNFGDFMDGAYMAHSVYGYFNNGGGRCYIVRVGGGEGGASEGSIVAPMAALPANTGAELPSLNITALGAPEAASNISVEITYPSGTDDEPANPDLFNLIVRRGGEQVESHENLSFGRGRGVRSVTTVNQQSTVINLTVQPLPADMPLTEQRPKEGTYSLNLPAASADAPSQDLVSVSPGDFEGSTPDRTGLGGLEAIDDVTMLVVPDLMSAHQKGMIDLEGVQAVQTAMMLHCERMGDRVAILDCPPNMKPQDIENWRVNVANYDSSFAALYYPWLRVFDPVAGKSILMPPSGHMAGIWARNDGTRGVHKAPANEVVGGALDVEFQITRGEQDGLNPVGINCIRAFPGRGIRVWGARTLSSNPSWTYLNVRRLFNMIEKSIDGGTQWVVFEPNDFALWQKIVRTIGAFLNMQWRAGALFGATPAQAFYVKCDAETNPPEARDLGMVTTEIGIAPVKPAEFVIFRISQWSPEA